MGLVRASKFVVGWCGVMLLLLTAGCSTEFERRYDVAEGLRLQAAERGFEWIGTQELLEQALEMAAEGETTGALELVEKARVQADAAIRQSEREAEAWKGRVIR